MSDPTTPAKSLTLPALGDDENVWGNDINGDLSLIDSALGGTLALTISGNTTLTRTQVENTGYEFSGTLTATATIMWPSFFGFAFIENSTTGGFSINCGISGGSFVTLFNGEAVSIWSDGTNFIQTTTVGNGHGVVGHGAVVLADAPTITSPTIISPIFTTPLSTANGGTGLDTYGALDGTSTVKTSTYSVANSDKRSTISLGGNAGYTVTVPAASGFDADFQVRLYNADSGRAKTLAISGYSSFFLWPLQSVVIQNIGGGWQLYPRQQRWQLPPVNGGTPFYVDPSGNDANDGLTPGSAFETVLACWLTIRDQTDGSAYIQLTLGATYPPFGELDGDDTASFGRLIHIMGDSTLANPPRVIATITGERCVTVRDGMWIIFNGILFGATATGCIGVDIQQKALADFQNCFWASMVDGFHISCEDGGDCNISGPQTVDGNALAHWYINFGGKLIVGGTTIDCVHATSFFSDAFLVVTSQSRVQLQGTTFINTEGIGGLKYNLAHHAIVESGGAILPGGDAGTADATSNFY